MYSSVLLLILLDSVVVLVSSYVTLSRSNFSKVSEEAEGLFVFVRSESCEGCEALVKQFATAEEAVRMANVTWGILNYSEDREIATNTLQVTGIPSLVLMKKAASAASVDTPAVHEFGGNWEDVGPWLKRRMAPLATPLRKDEVENFVKDKNTAVIIEAKSWSKDLETLLEPYREIPEFAFIENKVFKESKALITIHRYGIPKTESFEYDEKEPSSRFVDWFLSAHLPLFGEINLSNLMSYVYGGGDKGFLWLIAPEKEYLKIRKWIPEVALKERELMWAVWINSESSPHTKTFIEDNLAPLREPGFVITDFNGAGRFRMSDEEEGAALNVNSLKQFIEKVKNGSAERHLISEAVPELDEKGIPIKNAAGFEPWVSEIALHLVDKRSADEKLAIVVTSSGCLRCKMFMTSLTSKLEKMKMKEVNTNFRFAVLDGYLNELDPKLLWKIDSYPSILAYNGTSGGATGLIKYEDATEHSSEEGSMDLGRIWKWLEETIGLPPFDDNDALNHDEL